MEINGVINVYKEKGYTSHDVVNILKRTLKAKAGHTGTLDPEACGVLPIVLGRSTKLADYIMAEDKVYEADIHFGVTTDTQDMTGSIVSDKRPVCIREQDFFDILERFQGEIIQIPPMYSAIKINGEKLYNLARKGIEVERKPRAVTIYGIDTVDLCAEKARIRVKCSKGTYIRTLCADIGEVLGCGAAMGELLRSKSGSFSLDNSLKLDDIKTLAADGRIVTRIIPPDVILKDYPRIDVCYEALKFIRNGNSINEKFIEEQGEQPIIGQKYRLYFKKEQFIGLYAFTDGGLLKPIVILRDLNKV